MPVLECARCNELFYSASASRFTNCERCNGTVWRVFDTEASFDHVIALPRNAQPGDHAAIIYSDTERAADFCLTYIRAGLGRRERVVALLPDSLREAVHRRLSSAEREQLRLEGSADVYADFDPERVAAMYVDLARSAGGPLRVLAGPDGDAAAPIELDAWRRYEAAVHERAHELGVTGLCVYDGPSLPAEFMHVALRAHPLIVGHGGELRRNGEFRYQAPD